MSESFEEPLLEMSDNQLHNQTELEPVEEQELNDWNDVRALVHSAQEGNEQAFELIIKKYKRQVYGILYKLVRNPEDAHDLMQETFIKAFRKINSFDEKFAFSTWLFKIATNTGIDFLRRKRMQTLSLDSPMPNDENQTNTSFLQIVDTGLMPHEQVLIQQRKEYLTKAIEQLPTRYRQLVELRYFKEYSYEEVAKELNLPLGTVKAQLHRSRELLKELLKTIVTKL